MIKDLKQLLQKHKYWALLLQLLIILLIYLGFRAWQLRDAIRGPAPVIMGQQLNQQIFELTQFSGRPALIYFWASWCPMCKMSNHNIASIAEDYQVITIASWSGDASEVNSYLKQAGLEMPVIIDNDGHWAQEYGVKGVPSSFVIDHQGEIQFIESGYSTESGLRLRLWWLSRKG